MLAGFVVIWRPGIICLQAEGPPCLPMGPLHRVLMTQQPVSPRGRDGAGTFVTLPMGHPCQSSVSLLEARCWVWARHNVKAD